MKLPKLALCAVLFAAPAARAGGHRADADEAVRGHGDGAAGRLAKLHQAEGGAQNDQAQQLDERVTAIELGGQCGFAGCSSTTLVVFTYRTRGANTATSSVMALVSCPPIMRQGCTAVPAEVQPQGQLEQTR